MKLNTTVKKVLRGFFLIDFYYWIKELLFVVKNFRRETKNREREFIYLTKRNDELANRIETIYNESLFQRDKVLEAVNTIKERTNIHADISFNPYSTNQIITVGRYNNRDYVQVFNVEGEDMKYTIDMLKRMQEHGRIKSIDAPTMDCSFLRDEIFRS